ncbi:hypothetical protein M5D96_007980 [Drosophila gunungcola]|uniref:BPTI/Kunitz inhibitor domain-containing protein n=1 Tax=Drosophila gunungcola TaxID=103775 RepID=A0A9Q0BNS8_9MUSC|nr:hypothetical protein M5D96_007980 [Drosophila gunungcola]
MKLILCLFGILLVVLNHSVISIDNERCSDNTPIEDNCGGKPKPAWTYTLNVCWKVQDTGCKSKNIFNTVAECEKVCY